MTPTVSLGRVAAFHKGARLSKAGLRADGRVRCVHYGELFTKYGAVIRSTTSRTDEQLPVSSVAGDVLMPTSDVTPRGLAKASAIMLSGVALGGDILVIRPDKSRVDSRYLAYALRHDENQVLSFVRGSTVYHLYAADMRHFELELPSKHEQSVIADMLEHLDSVIYARERLIAKKQAIKRGLLQQLLTGRARLPGFAEPWRDRTYADLVTIRRGEVFVGRDAVCGGTIPVIAGGREPAAYTDRANRVAPVITISASGASAGFVAFYERDIFASDCSTISSSSAYDLRFIYYSLVLRQEEIYRAQTGGAQPHVHARDVYPISVVVPPTLDEQRAIADVMVAAEEEVNALGARLAKARAIKAGMMQQLLTGRTRLPLEAAS